jgi:hypothetical protein
MERVLKLISECPACGSKEIRDTSVNPDFYLSNMGKTFTVAYSACLECDSIFQSQYPSLEFLDYHYSISTMLRRTGATEYEKDQCRRQTGFITDNLPPSFGPFKGTSVFEIGAGSGFFLEYLHQEHECACYFEEASDEATDLMESVPGLKNIRGEKGPKPKLIVLRHVLEHIIEPEQFLLDLRTRVHKEGAMFIEVPDWTHLDSDTDPLLFEHLHQFSASGLVELLRRSGWLTHALLKSIEPDDPATPNRVMRLMAAPAPAHGKTDVRFGEYFRERLQKAHRNLDAILQDLEPGSSIALYPASHLSFSALLDSRLPEFNVLGYFDIDEKKHGEEHLGLSVFPAGELKEKKPDLIFIMTLAYEPEVRDSFEKMELGSQVYSMRQLLELNP